MSGIFDKIKEKKADWDKKKEEEKVARIQKRTDELFKNFKKDIEKRLGKMGLPLSYLTLSGADARQRNAGVIIARFNDNEGYPITIAHSQLVYEGGVTDKPVVYTGATLWGSIVQGSIPFTLLFMEVDKGLMKGTAKVFLPLTSATFDGREMLNDPRLQEPVVAALNSDKKLVDAFKALSLNTSIMLTSKTTMNITCSDVGGKCTIVPAGDETAIFLRTYGPIQGQYGDARTMLGMFSRIRGHILAHPHTDKVSGMVPAPAFTTMFALCKASSPEPSKEAMF